jgi:hypothetical protein
MVKIPNMLVENEDYELVPGDQEHWHIRIKQGEYIESVISFGAIKVNEKSMELNFDFTLHYSPDDDLSTDDNDFQRYAGKILESVLMGNLEKAENK